MSVQGGSGKNILYWTVGHPFLFQRSYFLQVSLTINTFPYNTRCTYFTSLSCANSSCKRAKSYLLKSASPMLFFSKLPSTQKFVLLVANGDSRVLHVVGSWLQRIWRSSASPAFFKTTARLYAALACVSVQINQVLLLFVNRFCYFWSIWSDNQSRAWSNNNVTENPSITNDWIIK